MTPTITQLKNLLRMYRERRWCFIWRDALGIHMRDHHWGQRIVGDLKWARWKGVR